MLDRENAFGFLLLGVCGVVAVILIVAISNGERPELNLNPVVGTVLGLVFFGLVIFGMFRNRMPGRGSTRGAQWPNPQTGQQQKSLWDRIRGR